MNDGIDGFLSKMTPDRAKELQGKKNALKKEGKRLEMAEHRELNQLLSAVFSLDEYGRLIQNKQQWLDNYIHQLSHDIVTACAQKGIDVIVIGRNKLWKQAMDMGRKNNRAFGQIAHAKLIEQIKYKAWLKGIFVIKTEESYTSKTSFVDNAVLPDYATVKESESNIDTSLTALKGKRSDDRNWFINTTRNDRWRKVHADVNGAFNIIRKAFAWFQYHTKLTLKFNLYRFAPSQGMTPFQFKNCLSGVPANSASSLSGFCPAI